MAEKRRPSGRPGPVMPCGWNCGAMLTARQMRIHFAQCPKRPPAPPVYVFPLDKALEMRAAGDSLRSIARKMGTNDHAIKLGLERAAREMKGSA